MRKVLFISAALEMSDSSAAIRNRKLVNALSKNFQVDSIEFSPLNSEKLNELSNINNTVLKMPFSFQRNTSKQEKPKNSLSKIKNKIKYYTKSLVPDSYAAKYNYMVSSIEKNIPTQAYEIVIISSDPKGVQFLWFSSFIKNLIDNGAETYQYWGDPWAGDVATYNNFFTEIIEKKIYSKSDYIILNTKGTLFDKSKKSKNKEKFIFLDRGLDCDVAALPEQVSITLGAKLRFIYAGDFHSKFRNLNPFCEAIKSSIHELIIVGNGDLETNYYQLENINIKPRVPYKKISELIESGDVLLVLLNKFGNQIPGKIYDLACEKKPVIILYDNDEILHSIPFPNRFILVKNEKKAIESIISQISNCKISINYKDLKTESYQEKVLKIFDAGKV